MPCFLNTFLIVNLPTCAIFGVVGVTGVTGEYAMGSKTWRLVSAGEEWL